MATDNNLTIPYDDFTNGRRTKSVIVLNVHNYPAVINEEGQTLGGMKAGKCLAADLVLQGAIKLGLVIVVWTPEDKRGS